MTSIRTLMNRQTGFDDPRLSLQLMSSALLLVGLLLTLSGIAQQAPLMIALGVIGVFGGFNLQVAPRDEA